LHRGNIKGKVSYRSNRNQNNFEIFNVGPADILKVLDIAKIVIKEMALGDVDLNFIQNEIDGRGWKGDVREFLLDCSFLRSLGWKPEKNSREAVKYTARLYSQTLKSAL
jgi:nucleoside-diphosphate-sugar epimerase